MTAKKTTTLKFTSNLNGNLNREVNTTFLHLVPNAKFKNMQKGDKVKIYYKTTDCKIGTAQVVSNFLIGNFINSDNFMLMNFGYSSNTMKTIFNKLYKINPNTENMRAILFVWEKKEVKLKEKVHSNFKTEQDENKIYKAREKPRGIYKKNDETKIYKKRGRKPKVKEIKTIVVL